MTKQFQTVVAVLVVGACLLGLAGCGGSAAKGKTAAAAPAASNGALAAGDAALARGDQNEAGRLYLTALKSGTDAAVVHTRLGDLYLGSAAYGKARDAYQQALKANGKYAPALQGMGFALYLGGGKTQAGQFLSQALALDPSLSRAAALLGTLENRDGRADVALAVSEASLAVAFDADVENNRGISLMLLGRSEEAATAFRRAVAAKKSIKFSNNLGLALCRLGRYDEAYAAFAGVGTESAALNNLGVCYMESGNKAKAQEFFEKAIAANPRFYPQAHDNLTRLSAVEEVTLPAAVPAQPATGQQPPVVPAAAAPVDAPVQPVAASPVPAAGKPAAPPAAVPPKPASPVPVAVPPAQAGAGPTTPAPAAAAAPAQPAPAVPASAAIPAATPAPAPVQTPPASATPAVATPPVQEPKPFAAPGSAAVSPPPAKPRPAAVPSAAEKADRSEMP
ncbi:tetratricopeptide repeat protein [Solidesulfovibrio sp.]